MSSAIEVLKEMYDSNKFSFTQECAIKEALLALEQNHDWDSYTKKTVTEYCKFKKEFDRNKVSINFDLDTHSNHYAIITDGQVEVWDAMYDLPISKLIQYHIPESSMGRL